MKPKIIDITEELEYLDNMSQNLLEADPPENKDATKNPSTGGDNPPVGGDQTTGTTNEDPLGFGSDTGGENAPDDLLGTNANEPDYSLTDLGRVYTLDNIYKTLNELIDYSTQILSLKYNDKINEIRNKLIKSKELFILLSNNIEKYTEKLDTIIDEYKKFVSIASKIIYEYAEKNKLLEI